MEYMGIVIIKYIIFLLFKNYNKNHKIKNKGQSIKSNLINFKICLISKIINYKFVFIT